MTPAQTPQPTQRLHDGTAAGTWTLDPAASSITVAVKHFWGLVTVRGTFTSATGHADINADGTITASLEVDAASINTKINKRDQHLRSDEFFNVENHPTITFTTADVTVVDATTVRVSGVVTAGGADQTTTFDATLAADERPRHRRRRGRHRPQGPRHDLEPPRHDQTDDPAHPRPHLHADLSVIPTSDYPQNTGAA